jgi:hypothetical protein
VVLLRPFFLTTPSCLERQKDSSQLWPREPQTVEGSPFIGQGQTEQPKNPVLRGELQKVIAKVRCLREVRVNLDPPKGRAGIAST